MGYYVQSYLTDSDEIKKVYGSKNKTLLSSLLKKLSKELNELNDYFEDKLSDKINSQEILTDFINGEIRFPELDFMYGYVYEKMCEHYGKQVSPPNDEYSTDYYWNIDKTPQAFVNIPFTNDFPEIYSISKNELKLEKDRFLALKNIEGIDKEDLKMDKEDFRFIFNKAIKENKDLVFFVY